MAGNTNKEKWIDDVLNSMQGASVAQPGEGLYDRVMMQMSTPRPETGRPVPVKQWVAAAILLLALNVGSVIYFTSQKGNTVTTCTNLAYLKKELRGMK